MTKVYLLGLFGSLFLLVSCGNNNLDPDPTPYRAQVIVSPSELSSFKSRDTIHFALLTDTAEPVQVL